MYDFLIGIIAGVITELIVVGIVYLIKKLYDYLKKSICVIYKTINLAHDFGYELFLYQKHTIVR